MTGKTVPPTLRYYRLSQRTLVLTRDVLRARGNEGFEATVLWLGAPLDAWRAEIFAPYVPEQIGYRSEQGVAVRVTDDGLSALIRGLPEGVFVLCRVHSHPGAAYHSATDDDNLIIGHPGAISVVVPCFARDPIDLARCSVNELVHGQGWRELPPEEVHERFEVVA